MRKTTILLSLLLLTLLSCGKPANEDKTKALAQEAEAHFSRGCEYLKKGGFDIDEAESIKPENLHFADSAVAEFNKAIQLNPKHAEAYKNRAFMHYFIDEEEKAFADFEQAIQLNPKDADIYLKRASIYLSASAHTLNGDSLLSKAFADFEQAISLNPNLANAYIGRGVVYYAKEEYGKAIADLTQAIKLKPNNYAPYIVRGDAYMEKAIPDSAIADFEIALRLGSKEPIVNSFIEQRLGEARLLRDGSVKTFADPRDGKQYKMVKIGEQTWMAENINYETENSWCFYKDSNCKAYGRLYDWNTAKDICPKGWHLPSNGEWEELVKTAGGEKEARKKLKSKRGWMFGNNGTDDYGFSALPAGERTSLDHDNYGVYSFWWSASKDDGGNAYYWEIFADSNGPTQSKSESDRPRWYSVRCVQD